MPEAVPTTVDPTLLQSLTDSGFASVAFGALGGLLFMWGVLYLSRGLSQLRRWLRIKNVSRAPIQSALTGPVEVAGTARPGDRPLTQPFGEDSCVFAHWTIYEAGRSGPLARGTHSGPFRLEDDTATAFVDDPLAGLTDSQPSITTDEETGSVTLAYGDVGGGDLSIPAVVFRLSTTKRNTIAVDPEEEPPASIIDWCRVNDIPPVSNRKRQYVQYLIPVGATLRLRGEAQLPTGTDDTLRLERDSVSGQLVVTDGEDVSAGNHLTVLVGLLSGALIYGVGGLWLLFSVL